MVEWIDITHDIPVRCFNLLLSSGACDYSSLTKWSRLQRKVWMCLNIDIYKRTNNDTIAEHKLMPIAI
jgi:hypothetical protein